MQGECDHSVVELAEMIGGSRRPADVKGLIWRDPNGVVQANERDWIPDLNPLPVTDRAFLDRYYRQGM